MKSTAALMLALTLLLAACGRSEPTPTAPAGPLVSTVTPSAETLAKFAEADAKDGTVDHVITLCPNCGLRMSGKPEFSCRIGEYTTHSCTKRCSQSVCEDPDGIFEEIESPAK